jgi:hypothetical protein
MSTVMNIYIKRQHTTRGTMGTPLDGKRSEVCGAVFEPHSKSFKRGRRIMRVVLSFGVEKYYTLTFL